MALIQEKAINKILNQFAEFSKLILKQLDLMSDIISNPELLSDELVKKKLTKTEKKIDQLEVKLNEGIIRVIVLHKPVATDLRRIMSCFRISTDLERIGDRIINISKCITAIEKRAITPELTTLLKEIFDTTHKMVEDALFSFINDEIEIAFDILKSDELVDAMDKKLLNQSLKEKELSKNVKESILSYIDVRTILSNIERIADHATNIAEASIYSLEGKDVRHQRLKDILGE